MLYEVYVKRVRIIRSTLRRRDIIKRRTMRVRIRVITRKPISVRVRISVSIIIVYVQVKLQVK